MGDIEGEEGKGRRRKERREGSGGLKKGVGKEGEREGKGRREEKR